MPWSAGARLIVVSNRLPLTLRKTDDGWTTERSSGGLASAMNPLLRQGGGDWIGWAGHSPEGDAESRRDVLAQWAEKDRCFAVDLPEEVASGFYQGYANQTLWPVFHNFPSLLKFESSAWESYVEANRIFCEAVVQRYKSNDLIWIHDYHLILLPQMLRNRCRTRRSGSFSTFPFPPPKSSRFCPDAKSCLKVFSARTCLPFRLTDICSSSAPPCYAFSGWKAKSSKWQ